MPLSRPLLVPFVAAHFGWRSSFLATGVLDVDLARFVVLHIPCACPKSDGSQPGERNLIESDGPDRTRRIPYALAACARGLHGLSCWVSF